jgi:exopolysaccharide biosynthesis predicted pyruvyltransferase EpsI
MIYREYSERLATLRSQYDDGFFSTNEYASHCDRVKAEYEVSANPGAVMVRWYRGEATDAEVSQLAAAKLLKITNRLYGHVAATAKGMRLANKTLGGDTNNESPRPLTDLTTRSIRTLG